MKHHITESERIQRDRVLHAVTACILNDRTIKLPDFNKSLSQPSGTALVSVGIEPNPFGGSVGEFRYQFEGEEDLLHLIVTRLNGDPLPAEEAQEVAGFVLETLPKSLIWRRPGELSHHFYFGHDDLLRGEG